MEKVLIETHGCTLNKADSEIIESILREQGFSAEKGQATIQNIINYDYIIINTCTVKKPTEQKMLDRLSRFSRSGKKIIVTGCLATASPEKVKKAVPDAAIVSTSRITEIGGVLSDAGKAGEADRLGYVRKDKMAYYSANSAVIARIPISEGCLSNCSFCETKFARGPLNSFSEELILRAISDSVKRGSKEIELASQDTGAYGFDKKTNIAELLQRASEIDGEFSIRVGMLNPEHLHKYFDELIAAYRMGKAFRFIHLPVQSASNKILRSMKRNYTIEDFNSYVSELRKKVPGISLETDIIVGYPLETEDDFEETARFAEEQRPNVTNISKFSIRPHAAASRMRQLHNGVVKERSVKMSRLVRRIQAEDLSKFIGRRKRVLITEKNAKSLSGRDEFYTQVAVLQGDREVPIGSYVEAEVVGNSYACLISKPV